MHVIVNVSDMDALRSLRSRSTTLAPADKAHFYAIARGSAMECAAIGDVVRSLGLAPIALSKDARWLLVRIVQMLTKLEAVTSVQRYRQPATS